MTKLHKLRQNASQPVLLITIAVGLAASGCSHAVYDDADARFPAPRLVQATYAPPKQPARKSYPRITPTVAQPVAPAPVITDRPDRPDRAGAPVAKQAANAPPATVPVASAIPTPASGPSTTVEVRASTAGRRASTETPASIAGVIEQAELLLRIGNIAGARNVLEPFATAKHPEALAELGKTFDPIELEKFLIAPGSGNATKAIELYTEAAGRGSLVAKLRLERLNTAPAPVEQQR